MTPEQSARFGWLPSDVTWETDDEPAPSDQQTPDTPDRSDRRNV